MKTHYHNTVCPTCKGKHLVDNRLCPNRLCGGTGFILRPVPTKKGLDNLAWVVLNKGGKR